MEIRNFCIIAHRSGVANKVVAGHIGAVDLRRRRKFLIQVEWLEPIGGTRLVDQYQHLVFEAGVALGITTGRSRRCRGAARVRLGLATLIEEAYVDLDPEQVLA